MSDIYASGENRYALASQWSDRDEHELHRPAKRLIRDDQIEKSAMLGHSRATCSWGCHWCSEQAVIANHFGGMSVDGEAVWTGMRMICDACSATERRADSPDSPDVSALEFHSRYSPILHPGVDSDLDICIERLCEVLAAIGGAR